jgi:ATP-dependent helicase HrpA
MKTVPQKLRHRLQPIGESAAAFMDAFEKGEFDNDRDSPLLQALQHFVEERVHLKLPLESFRPENLQAHCFMNFRVIDEHGRTLGQSRQLGQLRTRLKEQVAAKFETALVDSTASGKPDAETNAAPDKSPSTLTGLTAWTFGTLPELIEMKIGGREVVGFPALHDDGDSVSLRPYDTPEEAAKVHRRGLARLFALSLKDQVKAIERLPGLRELALQYRDFGTETELKTRLVEATLVRCCLDESLPADAETFDQLCTKARPRITLVAQEFMRLSTQLLAENATLQKRLTTLNKAFPEVVTDVRTQLAALLPPDFLLTFAWKHLHHFPRYLQATTLRLDKLRESPTRDAKAMAEWQALAHAWERETTTRRRAGVIDPELEAFRWLLEELRVSLFAQTLKTPMPVSVKRLQKIWDSRPR